MSSARVIDRLGHLAIRSRDPEATVRDAVRILGMDEVARVDGCAYLRVGPERYSLQVLAADADGLDHIGWDAAGPEGLQAVRDRVGQEGLTIVSERPLDPGPQAGFAFLAPDGVTHEVYVGMPAGGAPYVPSGVRPKRLGHVTMHPTDPPAVAAFLQRVLGLRLSDTVGDDGFFLRCNTEHHAVALFRGRGRLHHHAWEVQGLADLGRLGDVLAGQRRRLLWGPVRHGVGENIAAYYLEPTGSVVELYADMEHIYDEGSFAPRRWEADDPWWYSQWAEERPAGFREHGLVPVDRDRIN
jgi:catechol 2,3-dioxygenase-like lactoylglutathione lyase family enzyme